METKDEVQKMETKDEVQKPVVLTIYASEPPAEVGKQVVHFRRKKVAEADAFRAVLVPSYELPTAMYEKGDTQGAGQITVEDAEEVFGVAIAEAFLDAAASILRRYCEEKKDAKDIPAYFLDFNSVVTEMSQQQTSQRLNGDTIAAWYDASKTKDEAAVRYGVEEKGKKQQAALREKYLSLASNNPAIPQPLAVKMLAYVSTSDAEHPTAKAVIRRLEKLMATTPDANDL